MVSDPGLLFGSRGGCPDGKSREELARIGRDDFCMQLFGDFQAELGLPDACRSQQDDERRSLGCHDGKRLAAEKGTNPTRRRSAAGQASWKKPLRWLPLRGWSLCPLQRDGGGSVIVLFVRVAFVEVESFSVQVIFIEVLVSVKVFVQVQGGVGNHLFVEVDGLLRRIAFLA